MPWTEHGTTFQEVQRRYARQHVGEEFLGLPDGFGPLRRPAVNGLYYHGAPPEETDGPSLFRVIRRPFGDDTVSRSKFAVINWNPRELTVLSPDTFCGKCRRAGGDHQFDV